MAVATTFAGFKPEAIQFLADLAQNNERDWFQPRKADYERLLKEPLAALCVALDGEFRTRGIPLHADAARSPFRIYRDVRFAKDKSPYKTAASASFGWLDDDGSAAGGRSHADNVHASGGYFQLQPGDVFVGGGVWHPDPSWLKGFRERVANRTDEFRAIVEAPDFVAAFGSVSDDGESLKRVPPGYSPDHPAADLLRKKNVTFGRRLSDDDAFSPELPSILADAFAVGTPLMRYLATI
ncbi:MAG TPA: DUF2461 domain-containing protein [Candidatus Limnocylindrales bacterium]|jgi:uncharacterized protein (TIGR02453 family)